MLLLPAPGSLGGDIMSYKAVGLYNTGVVNEPAFLGRIGRQTLTAAQAVALDTNGLLETTALPTGAAADYTTFAHPMPYASASASATLLSKMQDARYAIEL